MRFDGTVVTQKEGKGLWAETQGSVRGHTPEEQHQGPPAAILNWLISAESYSTQVDPRLKVFTEDTKQTNNKKQRKPNCCTTYCWYQKMSDHITQGFQKFSGFSLVEIDPL